MSLEIRQLLIKSNVVHRRDAVPEGQTAPVSEQFVENVKEDILAECRRMIADLLGERGER
jgi:hypothetical protein